MRYRPTKTLNKVINGAVASAISVLLLALIRHYAWPSLSDDLAAAITTLVTAGVGYAAAWLTPIAPGEIVEARDA
jgi:hypothetical protein